MRSKSCNILYIIKINKIQDINPRILQSIKNWFKIVKVFDGKKPNHIAYDEKIFNKEQTLHTIL